MPLTFQSLDYLCNFAVQELISRLAGMSMSGKQGVCLMSVGRERCSFVLGVSLKGIVEFGAKERVAVILLQDILCVSLQERLIVEVGLGSRFRCGGTSFWQGGRFQLGFIAHVIFLWLFDNSELVGGFVLLSEHQINIIRAKPDQLWLRWRIPQISLQKALVFFLGRWDWRCFITYRTERFLS